MAGQEQSRAKVSRKSPASKAAKPSAAAPNAMTKDSKQLELRVKIAESECESLKSELAATREEIRLLKSKHAQAVNQIDWVLDSLHNIVGDKH